jgi:hypothetical protein
MRKSTLIFAAIFLYSILSFAQKEINKATFNKYVDYANCKYTAATLRNDKKEKNNIAAYDKNIKPTLENATLEKSPTIMELHSLLNNSWQKTYSMLTAVIDGYKIYHTKLEQLVDTLKQQVEARKQQVDARKQSENSAQIWLLRIGIILVAIIIGLGAFFFFIFKRKIASVVTGNKKIKNFIAKEIPAQIKDKTSHQISNKQIDEIVEKITPIIIERIIPTLIDRITPAIIKRVKLAGASKPAGVEFFRSKQGKTLLEEVSDEREASFKVFDINHSEAKFEYCGGVVNIDFFNDICTFENNPAKVPNKTKIITAAPGTVREGSNSSWEVDTPAKIKFV